MEDSRRQFLKIAGVTVLGGVGAPVVTALANEENKEAASGTQWAMVVDLRRCQRDNGCTDCTTACHKAHNVPNVADPQYKLSEEEIRKREVKWIWKEKFPNAFPNLEHPYLKEGLSDNDAPVLCNHCENPPCVRVCPTQATWKRDKDGIVMMDMHRCIGCRYCVVACPYGSRSFNWYDPREFLPEDQINMAFPTRTKGVVEKCNFCAERLAIGLQPACVESCKNRALTFGNIADPNSAVRRILNTRYTIRRKAHLGTGPQVYYVV